MVNTGHSSVRKRVRISLFELITDCTTNLTLIQQSGTGYYEQPVAFKSTGFTIHNVTVQGFLFQVYFILKNKKKNTSGFFWDWVGVGLQNTSPLHTKWYQNVPSPLKQKGYLSGSLRNQAFWTLLELYWDSQTPRGWKQPESKTSCRDSTHQSRFIAEIPSRLLNQAEGLKCFICLRRLKQSFWRLIQKWLAFSFSFSLETWSVGWITELQLVVFSCHCILSIKWQ